MIDMEGQSLTHHWYFPARSIGGVSLGNKFQLVIVPLLSGSMFQRSRAWNFRLYFTYSYKIHAIRPTRYNTLTQVRLQFFNKYT
jgi:hypothetical protein